MLQSTNKFNCWAFCNYFSVRTPYLMTHVDMCLLTSCNCGQHERCHKMTKEKQGRGPGTMKQRKLIQLMLKHIYLPSPTSQQNSAPVS